MSISTIEQLALPSLLGIKFAKDSMFVSFDDGRTIIVPLAWYPKLAFASRKSLERYEISPRGYGVHWPDLDEDLSVYGFLFPQGRREN